MNIVTIILMVVFYGIGFGAVFLFFVGLVMAIVDKIKEHRENKKLAVKEKA